MDKPTSQQIAKLPVWAQQHIENIQRERDVSVRELNAWCDAQTESPISIQEAICTGEAKGPTFKTRYIEGRKIHFEWAGVELDVMLRDKSIDLQWSSFPRRNETAMIPQSFQQVKLVSKANLRE